MSSIVSSIVGAHGVEGSGCAERDARYHQTTAVSRRRRRLWRRARTGWSM